MPDTDRIERTQFNFLGRRVGTFTGWDQHDTMVFTFYGVQPYIGHGRMSGDWNIDLDRGIIEVNEQEFDIVEELKSLPLA